MDCKESIVPLLMFPITAMQTQLFTKPLLSNICCIAVSFAVAA
jgi:hypothetical protein